MTYKLMNLFPLTIFQDQIIIPEVNKKELISHIIVSSKKTQILKIKKKILDR